MKPLEDVNAPEAADGLDEAFEGSVGVDGALETPPPIELTLVVVDVCKGRPSLSKKESANSANSAAVMLSTS